MDILAVNGSFSVKDIEAAKTFYTETLGLKLDSSEMGLQLGLPGGGHLFIYPKDDHQPATFTVLNLVVKDIEAAVEELAGKGVSFEHYDSGMIKTDEKGIARGLAAGKGPDIAWFKDPSDNILAVLQMD
jgi:catechol 2,3-dioxygenase-like lactoylglutathione lyase family enzyme